MANKSISERQQYWLKHVRAADTGKESIVAYAKHNGLKAEDLYQWKTKLIKLGFYEVGTATSDFVPVKSDTPLHTLLSNQDSRCDLVFPNGLRLEFQSSVLSDVIRAVVGTASVPD